MKNPAWLLDFASKVYSQTGEDGIIEKILEILPETDHWCVEFGAWDGLQSSNSRNLIENHQYQAVLIEGNLEKSQELKRNYARNVNVHPINSFVGFQREDGLDAILKNTPIPINFDFLSIDIDGNDYHVWQAMEVYKPKCICVEYNPTIPTEVEFVQPADPSVNQGNSLLSLVKLGQSKGYELVCAMQFNAFFVRQEYFPLFEIPDNRPEFLRRDLSKITYIFSTYDGLVHFHGFGGLPWHNVKLAESLIQPLPGFLRKFPSNYGALEMFFYRIFKTLMGWRGLNIKHSWQNGASSGGKNRNQNRKKKNAK
jgi:hypothetical protein